MRNEICFVSIKAICLIWCFMGLIEGNRAADFDGKKYGAKADGKSDDNKV